MPNLNLIAGGIIGLVALVAIGYVIYLARKRGEQKGVQNENEAVIKAEGPLADSLYDKPVNEFSVRDNDAWKGIAEGTPISIGLDPDSHPEGQTGKVPDDRGQG